MSLTLPKTVVMNARGQQQSKNVQDAVEAIGSHRKRRGRYALSNERAFAKIDSPDSAYWLGFAWADGYPSKDGLRVSLHEEDGGHLISLRDFFGSDAPVRTIVPPLKGNLQHQLRIDSHAVRDDLASLGLVPRRAERNIAPPTLAEEFQPHFFRGLVDGDGAIRRDARYRFFLSGWGVWLAGSEAVVNAFGAFLDRTTDGKYAIYQNGSNPSNKQLFTFGPTAVQVLRALYNQPGPALECHAVVARTVLRYHDSATSAGLETVMRAGKLVYRNRQRAEGLRGDFLNDLSQVVRPQKKQRWFVPKRFGTSPAGGADIRAEAA